MDGYQLTAKLRKARRRFRLTALEQALYYELIAICNDEGWPEVFCCSNFELRSALGDIDEKTLIRGRLSLINAGLLFYKSGKSKRTVSNYSFVLTTDTTGTTAGNIPVDVPAVPPVDTPANVPDYIKTKRESKTKEEKKETELIFPFQSEKFMSTWKMLAKTPKWKKKIDHSLQLALKKLGEYDEEFSIELMEQAIAGGWQGVIFSETNNQYKKWLNGRKTEQNTGSGGSVKVRSINF